MHKTFLLILCLIHYTTVIAMSKQPDSAPHFFQQFKKCYREIDTTITKNKRLDANNTAFHSQENLASIMMQYSCVATSMFLVNYGLHYIHPQLFSVQHPLLLFGTSVVAAASGYLVTEVKNLAKILIKPFLHLPLYQCAKRTPVLCNFPCVYTARNAELLEHRLSLRALAQKKCMTAKELDATKTLFDTEITDTKRANKIIADSFNPGDKRILQADQQIRETIKSLDHDSLEAIKITINYGQMVKKEYIHRNIINTKTAFFTALPCGLAAGYALAHATKYFFSHNNQIGWCNIGLLAGAALGNIIAQGTDYKKFPFFSLFSAIHARSCHIHKNKQKADEAKNRLTALKSLQQLNRQQLNAIKKIMKFAIEYSYCPLLGKEKLLLTPTVARNALSLVEQYSPQTTASTSITQQDHHE